MRIAICDDDRQDRERLLEGLRRELSARRVLAEIVLFSAGEGLLRACVENPFDICFLDIYLQGASGVETARALRAAAPQAVLVFTTSSPDHMADGYEVGAVHYLVKPFAAAQLGAALDRCLRLTGRREGYIEVTANRQLNRVLFSQLVSAESSDKTCILRLTEGELHPYLRLDDLQGMLDDPRFLRCHRSFIINMDHAQGVRGGAFLLTGGLTAPIRREQRAQIKAAFEDYCFQKMRRGV